MSGMSNWTPKSTELLPNRFLEVINAGPVFIQFYGPLTGKEQIIEDTLAQLANELRPPFALYRCNALDPANKPVRKNCNARAVPLVAIFVNGEPRRPLVGSLWVTNAKNEIDRRFRERPWYPRPWWQFWRKRQHFFTIPSESRGKTNPPSAH
jgi:hypothetical protein